MGGRVSCHGPFIDGFQAREYTRAEEVASITARGIRPAALGMMDGFTLPAGEEATHAGYPMDCAAVSLIEVEGLWEAVDQHAEEIEGVWNENRAREVRRARSVEERDLLWKRRKNAFGAPGRIRPRYYVQDGVIPRTRLPERLEFMGSIQRKYGPHIGNIFHAGDGSLHPLIMYDSRDTDQSARVLEAAKEIMGRSVEMGDRLPASTAWAWKRPTSCRWFFLTTIWI